jgi:hypothetical protein
VGRGFGFGGTTLPDCDGTQVLAGFANPRRRERRTC